MDTLSGLESGSKWTLKVPGLGYDVELPLVRIPHQGGGVRIASLNLVGQVRLNRDLGRLLAGLIRREVGDMTGTVVLTAVEKALQLAQATAQELDLVATAVAYNRVKPHMEPGARPMVQAAVGSITSGDKFLSLYERDINLLATAERCCIIDDVVSTGGTVLGLLDLLEEAARSLGKPAPEVAGIFCVAREGNPLLPAPLFSLAELPPPEPVA